MRTNRHAAISSRDFEERVHNHFSLLYLFKSWRWHKSTANDAEKRACEFVLALRIVNGQQRGHAVSLQSAWLQR